MSRSEQKQLTRQRILEAAGRGFRKGGFGGVGVDGLAKEAGVTSGAFYVHFDSKAAAFQASVSQGMLALKQGLHHFQASHGANWWPEFVRFYLGEKRLCHLEESCGLQSLAPEVVRANQASREYFQAELLDAAKLVAAGPKSIDMPADTAAALSALATLIGAVTLARAVFDPDLANTIAANAERSLLPSCQ